MKTSDTDSYRAVRLIAHCFLVCALVAGSTTANPVDVGKCEAFTSDVCPDNEYITFYLYTSANPNVGQLLDLSEGNIASSYFNASNPTKIIVHGFNSDAKLFALVDMRKAYLSMGNHNIVAVDWSVLSQGPFTCYPTAINNGRHVGKCIAQLVQQLRKVSAEDIHVIGFSLGAHVVSFAANNLRPYLLPRITGLDPAMPLFVTSSNDEKLDASDASFVDVLHTNGFVQGKIEESGHVDFYMNGGTFQPGCGYVNQDSSGCSHTRAAQYFAESITSRKGFWGWQCSGYMAYILGMCSSKSPEVIMGEHVSKKSRGFIEVATDSKSPFALGPSVTDKQRKRSAQLSEQYVTYNTISVTTESTSG